MSTELKSDSFNDFISSGLVLVDFWAPWCGPCRMQIPILDQVAAAVPGVKIGKVNVDEEPDLAASYGVNTIPYLLVFKDGQKKAEFVGLRQANVLAEALKAADA
ncbi:MAG: thioredoxin [Kiritimatiellae bacterium]|nr:thioredoxin [Kiritimatiellia bacterium]MBR4253248.1 thioredoxin [Kiritimatiellia bacterium]